MFKPQNGRIPVTAGPRLLEMADPQRAAALMRSPNVRVILRHKRDVVELQVVDYGDSSRIPPKLGNPQKLSTNVESADNPPHVWKYKGLPFAKSGCVPTLNT